MSRQNESAPLPTSSLDQLPIIFGDSRPRTVESLRGNQWLTAGIWRIDFGSRSVILKHVEADGTGPLSDWDAHWTRHNKRPAHWNYWMREALAYQSDIVTRFRECGMSTPGLIHVEIGTNYSDLWIEDCTTPPAATWGIADYAESAQILGYVQGRYLSDFGLPDHPWLCRNYLHEYSAEKPFDLTSVFDDAHWHLPLMRSNFSPRLRDRLRKMVMNTDRLRTLSASVPETLCHNDFWTRNLFGGGCHPCTLIDWAFVGRGPIGADIGNMIPSAVFDGFLPADCLPVLATTLLDAYLEGLMSGGWVGDEEHVRIGFWSSAVKYSWLVPAMLYSAAQENNPVYVGYGGIEPARHFSDVAMTLDLLAGWTESALRLG